MVATFRMHHGAGARASAPRTPARTAPEAAPAARPAAAPRPGPNGAAAAASLPMGLAHEDVIPLDRERFQDF